MRLPLGAPKRADLGRARPAALVAIAVALLLAGVGTAIAAFAQSVPAPSGVQASVGTTGTAAVVTWDRLDAGFGIVAYRVWRHEDGKDDVVAGVVPGDRARFADDEGLSGVTYRYSVSAIDAGGRESGRSAATAPVKAGWVASPHVAVTPANVDSADTCAECHISHDAAVEQGLLRADGAVPLDAAVCYRCHAGGPGANVRDGVPDSFALLSGHALEPSGVAGDLTRGCGSCHDLHADASASPMLRPGTIVTRSGTQTVSSQVGWCIACHNVADDWWVERYGSAYPGPAEGVRETYGYPVTGTWPGPAIYADPERDPHASIPPSAGSGRAVGDCLFCHAAHRGANAYDGLRALYRPTSATTLDDDRATGAYAAACFYCHGGTRPSELGTLPADIKRYATSLSKNAGHRVISGSGLLPAGAPLPCYDCHNPHGTGASAYALLVVTQTGPGVNVALGDGPGEIVMGDGRSGADVRRFCLSCHTTADTAAGWDGSTMSPVRQGALVEGIDRVAAASALRLPTGTAHNESDARSCDACHGGDYSTANSYNVHNPTPGMPPSAAGQCSSCHDVPPAVTSGDSGVSTSAAEPAAE